VKCVKNLFFERLRMNIAVRQGLIALIVSAFASMSGCSEKKAEDPVSSGAPASELPAAPAAPVAPEAPAVNEVGASDSSVKKPSKKAAKKRAKKKRAAN
jgi:hypothetical protein